MRKALGYNYLRQKYPTLSYLVYARNVANVPEIEKFLQQFQGDQKISKWLGSSMRKWLLNTYDKTKQYKVTDSDPEWMKGKGDLEAVILDDDIRGRIEHVVDYVKNVTTENPSFKLENFQVPEAFKQAAEWQERLMKKKSEEEVEGTDYVVLKAYESGYRWCDLISENALVREGQQMGHCVGGYWERVKKGEEKIFSLRDAKNGPHCTIEFDPKDKNIAQIKGKQNKGVNDEYKSYLVDFLSAPLIEYKRVNSYDLEQSGLVKVKGGVVDIANIPDGTTIEIEQQTSYGDSDSPFPGQRRKGKKNGTFAPKGHLNLGANCTITGNLTLHSDQEEMTRARGLKVMGDMDIRKTSIDTLPQGLVVEGSIHAGGSGISHLPNDLKVKGDLDLDNTSLRELPANLHVGLSLDVSDTPLKELPKGLQVGREFDLMGTGVTALPEDLKVGDGIYVEDEEGMEIPEHLKEQVY